MSLTSWAVSTTKTCAECGNGFESATPNRAHCYTCRPRFSSVRTFGRIECKDCGDRFTPTGNGRRDVRCRGCLTRQAFLASQGLPSRPVAESDYAQALIPLVEAYERDQRRASQSRKVDLDGLFARDAVSLLVEGPMTARRFGRQLGITGDGYRPAKFLAAQLERAGWVETERVPSPEGGLLIALPPGTLPPPLRAALLGGRDRDVEGHAPAPDLEASATPEEAPDVDHREELDDRRAAEELRRRRWADGSWRRLNNAKTKKKRRKRKESGMAYDPRDCRDCGEEFTPVGPSQGRRSRCYECAPKGAPPKRAPKTRAEPEPEPEEEAELQEEDLELEDDHGEAEEELDRRDWSLIAERSEVRDRVEGLGRAAGLLAISLARRGLAVLEERLS